jgi:hypothetical protein
MTEINYYSVPENAQEEIKNYIEENFCGYEFNVMTEETREEQITEYIKESLWAFNSNFLADQTDLPEEVFKILSEKCESGNEPILKLVEKTCGLSELVEEAIRYDGYGHFLSPYDGNEEEMQINGEYFYIYRMN